MYDLEELCTGAWQTVLHKIQDRAEWGFGDGYPLYTDPQTGFWITAAADESGGLRDSGWHHGNWMAGFWPGLLWLAYAYTGEERYRQWAVQWLKPLEIRAQDQNTHDVGFLFWPSFVLGYRLTQDHALREIALVAADNLANRFNPKGRYIQAWGPLGHEGLRGTSTIDTMMNLPLLWWAHEEMGESLYRDIATAHAETTLRNLIRDDGSTVHLVKYDPESGSVEERTTFQGYSEDSCWSRGQAWGICGFAVASEYTGREDFLKTACRLADYFIRRLPEDYVPYWDFGDPAIPEAPRDSSAAAIAAYGILKLSELDPNGGDHYREAAEQIITSLSKTYVDHEGHTHGILKRGCYSKPQSEGTDSALIFGDYFYVATLFRLTQGRFT